MIVTSDIAECQEHLAAWHLVGFVPTMGALHAGHASLLEASLNQCEKTVLSIYVNPTQFNNPDDLAIYPDTLAEDLKLAESMGVDLVFTPSYQDIYPDDYRYLVDEKEFSKHLCGAHRPGHFTGVLTVVMKLFNIIKPQKAFFGEKDHQQLQLIKDMAKAFFLDVEVVGCATKRESDGLAMSSRNLNLTPGERRLAPTFSKILMDASSDEEAIVELTAAGFEVDYIETHQTRRYGAAVLGQVRLIDNIELAQEKAK